MAWVTDRAKEIAASIRGRNYLKTEYGVTFKAYGHDRWLASVCPLCSGMESFVLLEGGDRWCDWRCFMCPPKADGRVTNRGDLVDLVMSREKLDKADAIRLILKSGEPHRLAFDRSRILELAAEYFWLTRKMQETVIEYLHGRGIEPDKLNAAFRPGGNDVVYKALRDYLGVALGRPVCRRELEGAGVALLIGTRLVLRPAVTAPLYEQDGQFVGLQLRRCSENGTRHINRGLDRDVRARFLYGMNSEAVTSAIEQRGQVIVAEGVFDAWACYQRGALHVLATLSRGMTHQQYRRVRRLKVPELVLGLTFEEERRNVLALVGGEIDELAPKVMVLYYLTTADRDRRRRVGLDRALQGASAADVEQILRARELVIEANKRSDGLVLVRKARELHRRELEAGRYFVLPVSAVQEAIGQGPVSQGPSKKLVKLLEHHRGLDQREARGRYQKVPYAFVDSGLHRLTGACLRLLMHLHIKQSGTKPVNISNDTIVAQLGINLSGLKPQKRKLRRLGLLVTIPPGQKERRAWQHYPFYIALGDTNETMGDHN